MAIEISGSTPVQLSNAKAEVKGQVDRTDTPAARQKTGNPSTTDKVTLTDAATQLHKLAAAIANQPVVDTARVESVKQSILNGNFTINPRRVAEKMLSFEYARGRGVS